jgi:hypothetical protein
MTQYIDLRDPPPKRRSRCDDSQEKHLTEAAVMIAFGMYLLERGALTVELHPDGEHGKRHDLKKNLESHGLKLVRPQGTTLYGGAYQRDHQTVNVTLKPGFGDVVAEIGGKTLVAECKGGGVNTRHAGQLSKLRRGLCEAVGLLMARPLNGERHVAVVPATPETEKVARRMLPRAMAAGIEIALVNENGCVSFVK